MSLYRVKNNHQTMMLTNQRLVGADCNKKAGMRVGKVGQMVGFAIDALESRVASTVRERGTTEGMYIWQCTVLELHLNERNSRCSNVDANLYESCL